MSNTATNTTTKYQLVPAKEVNVYLTDGWALYGNPVPADSLIWQAIIKVSLS